MSEKLERRQIERCMKRCVNISKSDFTPREAIEHFYRISWLAPENSSAPKKVPPKMALLSQLKRHDGGGVVHPYLGTSRAKPISRK